MIRKRTKTITIDRFMEIWNLIKSGQFNKLAPDLLKDIRKAWGDEIVKRFQEDKSMGSFGAIANSSEELADLMRMFHVPTERIPYNEDYAERYGGITFVKTGDLRHEMFVEVALPATPFDKSGRGVVRINIPEMTNEPYGPNVVWDWEYCYAHLEKWRSFIRSSLLLAWPKILEIILDSIE